VALNKTQVRQLVRQLIDDPGAKLWSNTNLDLLIEGCLDEIWSDLLEQFAWLTTAESAPQVVDGVIYTSLLTVPRFHRVQRISRNGVDYRPARPEEVIGTFGTGLDAPDYTYVVFSDQIWTFPAEDNSDTYVRYSYLPEPFTSLTPGPDPDSEEDDDVSFVTFPDGHHMVYIYDVASKALEKGDKENSDRFTQRAQVARLRLMTYLRKQSVGPIQPLLGDSSREWGGV
jgi:hypothetical protein